MLTEKNIKTTIIKLTEILNDVAPQKSTFQAVKDAKSDGATDKDIATMLAGSLYDWLAYGK